MRLRRAVLIAGGGVLIAGAAQAAGAAAGDGGMPWWAWPLALFVVCFLMGIVAVPAGIGGGTLFVPIVGSFFPFHLDFVRGAGLLVALASALAAGPMLTVSGLPASGEVLVGVRPEHFVLERTDAGVPITVDVVDKLGGTRYLYGSTASGENVVVEVRDRPGIKAGDVVPVGINPARHMVFRATGERLRQGH